MPRIPLPDNLDYLQQSGQLGATIGKFLDVEKAVPGVSIGKLRKELSILGRIAGPVGLSLAVTAGWGHFQREEIVMPGGGLVKEREFSETEKMAIAEGAQDFGMTLDAILSIWGDTAIDVYLNNETHWATVPRAVWEYTIGGYLVLKKWLSYREHDILGRDITKDEAREFTHIVRRIAALILMEPTLDANYIAVKAAAYEWPQAESNEEESAEAQDDIHYSGKPRR